MIAVSGVRPTAFGRRTLRHEEQGEGIGEGLEGKAVDGAVSARHLLMASHVEKR